MSCRVNVESNVECQPMSRQIHVKSGQSVLCQFRSVSFCVKSDPCQAARVSCCVKSAPCRCPAGHVVPDRGVSACPCHVGATLWGRGSSAKKTLFFPQPADGKSSQNQRFVSGLRGRPILAWPGPGAKPGLGQGWGPRLGGQARAVCGPRASALPAVRSQLKSPNPRSAVRGRPRSVRLP